MHNYGRMRMITRLVLVALLVTTASACKHNKRANTTVRHRASFELSCPQDDLKLVVLDTEGVRKMSSLIGVQGCGQQAVYAYYPDSNTWLIDGAVAPIEEDFEPDARVTEGKGKSKEDKRAAKAERKGGMVADAPEPEEPTEKKKRRRDD